MPTRPHKRTRARADRCSYVEGGRRCVRNAAAGTNPPLCVACQIAVQEIARAGQRSAPQRLADLVGDLLAGKPINQREALGIAQDIFVEWGGMASQYRPPINMHGQTAHGRTAPFVPFGGWPGGPRAGPGWPGYSPPPPDPREQAQREAVVRARATMGFAASERLTEDMIVDRRKRLARKHHPDLGGSVDKMAEINNAADVLLESPKQW